MHKSKDESCKVEAIFTDFVRTFLMGINSLFMNSMRKSTIFKVEDLFRANALSEPSKIMLDIQSF